MKTNYFVLIIFFIPFFSYSHQLFELEKKRFENELKKSELLNEIESTKKKIQTNEVLISEKKKILAKYLKADGHLKKFEFGGLLAIEQPTRLSRNLKIFEILKSENLNSLRETNYLSQDLLLEKKKLQDQVDHLDTISKQLLKQEEELKTAETDVLQKLRTNKEASLLRQKGSLSAPISTNQIISPFGLLLDSKNKLSQFQKGLLYSVRPGQTVQAVGPGKIIFRDPIKYWGESIIIEHPGGYYSVYTQLKNCRIEVGQTVLQEEKLCETSGHEFYFELRNQSIAINPQNWIRN